ncbi:hypothetical protein PG299_10205 [Riemerella anatipestifer]|nr:hypothetical protein [Riemerella anatipestifer]
MKISFDFDGCLSQKHIQILAKSLIDKGHEVWIVTSRLDNLKRLQYADLSSNEDVFATAEKIGIPMHRVGFTNQQPKWMLLNPSRFDIHIDDSQDELNRLAYYNLVKGVHVDEIDKLELILNTTE